MIATPQFEAGAALRVGHLNGSESADGRPTLACEESAGGRPRGVRVWLV